MTELQSITPATLADFLTAAAVRHPGAGWARRYAKDACDTFGVDEENFKARVKTAARAHHEYEQGLGKRHDGWALWYANHMLGKKTH